MFQGQIPCTLEQHIDDDTFRWSQHHFIDELLVLDMAAVAADQLHPRPRERHFEHPR
jgi:hypothetical protein